MSGCVTGGYNPLGVLVAGPYLTDPDCGTVTERSEDLRTHITMVHDQGRLDKEADAKKAEADAKKIMAEVKKYEAETARAVSEQDPSSSQVPRGPEGQPRGERKAPMERPSMDEGVTEGDWSFFLAEWERYVEAVGLKDDGPGAVRHLWSACSEGLRRALHNDGARDVIEVKVLLSRIKSLAVKRRNNLVNVMTLQGMNQEREEGVHAFLARLNGQADLCDLQVICPPPTCQKEVSFNRGQGSPLMHQEPRR